MAPNAFSLGSRSLSMKVGLLKKRFEYQWGNVVPVSKTVVIPAKVGMTTLIAARQRITRRSLFSISATPSAGLTVRARIALPVVRMASDTSP